VPDQVYQRGYSVFPSPPVTAGPISPLGPGVGNPGASAVVGLSGQLVRQVDDFLRAFAPNARVVPQGRQFLADASMLRDAAARFQQMAAGGAPPATLANQFGAVAASWQRFESRMEQVAKGRMGPNIAKILQMGGTVQRIQGLLPLAGPPWIRPPPGQVPCIRANASTASRASFSPTPVISR